MFFIVLQLMGETMRKFLAGRQCRVWMGAVIVALVAVGCIPDPQEVDTVSVPAGTFPMGDAFSEGYNVELPLHDVTLDAYEIGTYEITNQQFDEVMTWAVRTRRARVLFDSVWCGQTELFQLDHVACQLTWAAGRFWVERRDGRSMADHPMQLVTWYGAVAFCNWLSEALELTPCYDLDTWELVNIDADGYRLPTEAEWERAAAWDADTETYWRYGCSANDLTLLSANFDNHNPALLSDVPYTTVVGRFASHSSPVGCFDMSGNVWEWCHDRYADLYYADCTGGVSNPLGPVTGEQRSLRGGGWDCNAFLNRAAGRSSKDPDRMDAGTGFRVVRRPD